MSFDNETLLFGFRLTLVGISVTFVSLILLYLMLVAFARYSQNLKKKGALISASEEIPEELITAVTVGIEKFLEEEREYIEPELRLEMRKPSAWKISGRREE